MTWFLPSSLDGTEDGVMEKCSLCIQMTQKTILDAKLIDTINFSGPQFKNDPGGLVQIFSEVFCFLVK